MGQSLTNKYAPRVLSDIYGQDLAVSYFKSVVARPAEAHRNYVILGSYGCGKTSLCRAFARELLGRDDLFSCPSYLEIDSSDSSLLDDFDRFLSYMFQAVPGYKVVVLDEVHLLDKKIQQKFLKPLEDFQGDIFFFFVSTEQDGIIQTLVSRSLVFHVTSYNDVQLREYLGVVLGKESLGFKDETLDMLVFMSFGHIRNMLNQLEICVFQGEEYYLGCYSSFEKDIASYFKERGSEVVERLVRYPFEMLRHYLEYYIRYSILYKGGVLPSKDIPKVFTTYLKLKRYVMTEQDFYSFLLVFKEFLDSVIR